ncbi:transposase [thermophilic bacterium 2918]|uniref:Transposase n=1 Tax=Thermogemmata fonticola TaxID=2755323 RepID=A0A7V8VAY6_9BACT|nr:transposase [Thermogemmata fonticola]
MQPIPPTSKHRRPRTWSPRHIVNAIFSVIRTGCPWRILPTAFPPGQTVSGYFRRWTDSGLKEPINAVLVGQVCQKAGRLPSPSAGIIDRQSVQTSPDPASGVLRWAPWDCGWWSWCTA